MYARAVAGSGFRDSPDVTYILRILPSDGGDPLTVPQRIRLSLEAASAAILEAADAVDELESAQ
jgi:hypothetical protein